MLKKITRKDVYRYLIEDDLESFKYYVENSQLIFRNVKNISLCYRNSKDDVCQIALIHLIYFSSTAQNRIPTYLVCTFPKEFKMIVEDDNPKRGYESTILHIKKIMKKIEIYG